MCVVVSEFLEEPVRYMPMAHVAYAQLGFPGAEDLANMFQYYCDFNHELCAQRRPHDGG